MCETLVALGVWRVLVNHTSECAWKREQLADVPARAIRFDTVKVTRVEKDVPIGHIDCFLETLRACSRMKSACDEW